MMKAKIYAGLILFFATVVLTACKSFQATNKENVVTVTDPYCFQNPYYNKVTMLDFAQFNCSKNFPGSLAILVKLNTSSCSGDYICSISGQIGTNNMSKTSSNSNQSSSDIEISRIELRTMQTRKFRKSPIAVVSAINELNKDKGNSCSGLEVPTYKCEGTFKDVSVGNAIVKKCIASDGVSSALVKTSGNNGVCKNKSGQISTYDIDSNYPSTSETIVRIRLSDNNNPQLTDPQIYSKLFKEIADGLFIDAIQLSPAEMQ